MEKFTWELLQKIIFIKYFYKSLWGLLINADKKKTTYIKTIITWLCKTMSFFKKKKIII